MSAPPQPSGVPAEHAAFEQLVSVLMSPDNAARAAGEAQFAAAKASSPDGLCAGLLSVLKSSASTDSRAFCAVLLRKVRMAGYSIVMWIWMARWRMTREGEGDREARARERERGRRGNEKAR